MKAIVVSLISMVLVALGFAMAYADDPVCFDRSQVFSAAHRLQLHMRWSGVVGNLDQVETAITMPERTLVLFLKSDGTTWSQWVFEGDIGCLNLKGPKWEHVKAWGEQRL